MANELRRDKDMNQTSRNTVNTVEFPVVVELLLFSLEYGSVEYRYYWSFLQIATAFAEVSP